MAVALTPEIKDLVNNALASGNPLLLAVVNPENKPVLSFRGSTQVYSGDQFGFWLRNKTGATFDAIQNNPNVAFVYRSVTTPVLQFHGVARIAGDEADRKRMFENAPEREQQSDPERKGAAIIVDLTKVEGVLKIGPDGPVFVKLG